MASTEVLDAAADVFGVDCIVVAVVSELPVGSAARNAVVALLAALDTAAEELALPTPVESASVSLEAEDGALLSIDDDDAVGWAVDEPSVSTVVGADGIGVVPISAACTETVEDVASVEIAMVASAAPADVIVMLFCDATALMLAAGCIACAEARDISRDTLVVGREATAAIVSLETGCADTAPLTSAAAVMFI